MASGILTAALLIFVLCLSGKRSMVQACVDVSCHIPCSGVIHPNDQEENNRICYKTTVDDTCAPTTCTTQVLEITNQTIVWAGMPEQAKIWSPGNLRGKNYQNKRYCQYHAACPPGHFMYFSWITGNFVIEDEDQVEGCLDYLKIQNLTGVTSERCGNLTVFSDTTSVPLKAVFRSNTGDRYVGFQMDLLCVDSEFNETNTTNETTSEFRRSVEYEEDSLLADGRFPGCIDLPDPNEGKEKEDYSNIKLQQTGNRVDVPRPAFIEYNNNVLEIVVKGEPLRVFEKIQALFFWTGFKGIRTFRGRAPSGAVYGGGELKVIRNYAYYSTDRIPPQLEPNSIEREVIGRLLSATRPFFEDQDILEDEYEKPTDHLSFTRLAQLPVTIKPTEPTKEQATSQQIDPRIDTRALFPERATSQQIDSRIDTRALEDSETFETACNVFLRAAAQSYLSILDEEKIRPEKKG